MYGPYWFPRNSRHRILFERKIGRQTSSEKIHFNGEAAFVWNGEINSFADERERQMNLCVCNRERVREKSSVFITVGKSQMWKINGNSFRKFSMCLSIHAQTLLNIYYTSTSVTYLHSQIYFYTCSYIP